MKIITKKIYVLSFFLFFAISNGVSQGKNTFKVVLDAGHGGTGKGGDPGSIKNGIKEKDINLAVTLKVGILLAKEKDITVVYTRKTDVFVPLNQRPKLANKEKADVFVSIHCNSVDNARPFGPETYVLGIAKDKHSLEVAKRENAVIFLEEDYQEKYRGYDPKNPESVVGLMLLQGEQKNQSIMLASAIQKDFGDNLKRNNRGVKEAGYLVLKDCVIPAILIELGFISNKNEANYLNSEKGQKELAESIAKAIISYKNEHYDTSEHFVAQQTDEIDKKLPIFKVQIAASGTNLDAKPENFKGLQTISKTKEKGLYKYFYGQTNDYITAKKLLSEARSKGYEDAFVVAFKNNVQIKLSEAIE